MATADHAVPVEPLGATATVVVNSGDVVYYNDNPTVSATRNIGSISAGSSVSLTVASWLKSAGVSSVTITTDAASSLAATYTLEGDYGAASSGSVQTALQNAVTDILANRGGGRLVLKDRVYDFDAIVWPTVGLDKPTPTLIIEGPRIPQAVGFMPGVGLTLAQGKDMPAPSAGAILRSSQVSGAAFGGLSGWSNILVVFRNVIVREPANPQWQAIDCGWCLNAVLDGVVVDQGRSWGDGSNPLSAGAIVQPTNTAVEGVIMPGAGNGGISRVRDLLVCGNYCGLRYSEHFDGDRVTLAKNVIGLRPADGYHAARIGRLSLYWNASGIQPVRFGGAGTPVTRTVVEACDFEEDAVGGNWYTTGYHLNDPNNYLRGRIRYHRVVPASGITSAINRRGAAYVNTPPLGEPEMAATDMVGFEGSDVASPLPNSAAGQAPTARTGTWGISGQRAYLSTVSGGVTGDQAVWETGLTNPDLVTRVRLPATVANSNLGLALFSVDATNWIGVFIANGNVSIQKSDTGVWTNLSGAQTIPAVSGSQEIHVRATVLGKTIRVYLDGTLRASYTLSGAEWTKYSASTFHGFIAYTSGFEPGGVNGGRWDALRVGPARAAVS